MKATRLPWPDRLGLGLAALVGLFWTAIFLWAILAGALAATETMSCWFLKVSKMLFFYEIATALPIWLISRVADFVIGGPARRRRLSQP